MVTENVKVTKTLLIKAQMHDAIMVIDNKPESRVCNNEDSLRTTNNFFIDSLSTNMLCHLFIPTPVLFRRLISILITLTTCFIVLVCFYNFLNYRMSHNVYTGKFTNSYFFYFLQYLKCNI